MLRRTRIFARLAAPSREEPESRVIAFSLSRQAENLFPRGRTEEEHERASHF